MHFLLTTLKVVYVLSTPSPVWSENETLKTTRNKMKWENDDYTCRGHILNTKRYVQPSSSKIVEDEVEGTDDVPGPSTHRKSTRTRKAKFFGSDFQLYLVEGTRDKTLSQREHCFIIEEDPRTLSEAMASRDVAFYKEAVQSEIDSIMHNDT
nr:zinc finger, CCHC-type [Tanacetum cinerariifolium]